MGPKKSRQKLQQRVRVVVRNMTLTELIVFEGWLQKEAYSSPYRETERQAKKRMAEQGRLREALKRVRAELRGLTKEIV